MTPRIAIATCSELPELAESEPMLLDALLARGVEAVPAVWDDEAIDWHAFDLVVIRCTWDYARRRDEFVAWASRVPRLLNHAEVVRWNTDKRYLATLPRAVQTELVAPGDAWDPPADEYVVKPTVSAGSRDTARYRPGEETRARAHVSGLHAAGRIAMVQPYLSAVDSDGETGLIFFAGAYSHAIRKGQMLRPGIAPTDGLYLEEDISAREPEPVERAVAEEILEGLPWAREELLYARVDLIRGADGKPRLIELELTEPSLFFDCSDGSADRLADEVLRRL
jgi:hypothetical protein